MNIPRRAAGDQRGVSFVEFAIALPLLLIVVFGLWELGRVFDAWLVVTNASREGARYAIATVDDAIVRDKVLAYINDGRAGGIGMSDLTIGDGDVLIDRPGTSGPARVTVSAQVAVLAPRIPGILDWIPEEFTVSSSTEMRQ